MNDVLLSVKDLEVTFKNGKETFTAVRKVNFDVHEGESFALVGESGSGKTTLARVIAHHTKSNFVTLNAVLAGVHLLRTRQVLPLTFVTPDLIRGPVRSSP